MGSGRDKRKKKSPNTAKESGAAKTERKTEAAERKRERRAHEAAARDGEDIDAILAELALEQRRKEAVTREVGCSPPSPRCNASLVAAPGAKGKGSDELVLFGGEWHDQAADRTYVYGDLYRYRVDRGQWTRVSSPTSPPPRSAHCAALHRGCMYVFGGEYTSPKQERFHHFKDLWRLDLATERWEELPLRGGPSARSGHRVCVHRGTAYVFGGFYDTGREVKYYGDLWALHLDELRWEPLGDPGALAPSPRSACQLALHEDTVFLYGGYHKAVDEDGEEKATVHCDCWALDLKSRRWEKVKRAGMAPGPRAGFGLVAHKRRAVMFGGVVDREAKGGDVLVSEFYNELYSLQMDSRRWFPLAMRRKKGEAADAEREPLRFVRATTKEGLAAVKIQANFRGYVVRKAFQVYRLGGPVSEMLYSPACAEAEPGAPPPRPVGRINPMLAVLGNVMWLLGGVLEVGDDEVSLDDMWRVDLAKLDGWQCVTPMSVQLPKEVDGVDLEDSDEDDEDEDEDDQPKKKAKTGEGSSVRPSAGKEKLKEKKKKKSKGDDDSEVSDLLDDLSGDDVDTSLIIPGGRSSRRGRGGGPMASYKYTGPADSDDDSD